MRKHDIGMLKVNQTSKNLKDNNRHLCEKLSYFEKDY